LAAGAGVACRRTVGATSAGPETGAAVWLKTGMAGPFGTAHPCQESPELIKPLPAAQNLARLMKHRQHSFALPPQRPQLLPPRRPVDLPWPPSTPARPVTRSESDPYIQPGRLPPQFRRPVPFFEADKVDWHHPGALFRLCGQPDGVETHQRLSEGNS